jgi:hypothetical protein
LQHPKLKGGEKTLSLRWTAEKQIFKKNCSGGIEDLAGGNGRISMYVVLSLVFIYYIVFSLVFKVRSSFLSFPILIIESVVGFEICTTF